MLPKANRLKNRRDFVGVYRQGIRQESAHLTLRALGPKLSPSQNARRPSHPTQIGIVIAKKVDKRAVYRNRIKRQIRAKLRQLLPEIQRGWRLVFIVRPSIQSCNSGEFLRELEQLLAQAEVLNGN
ncbi:ribonuclease P protein component [Roseofilum capinflatum]|uniref:Ribonuclease P protein component n=1 Tax=Roseofilum capinflatum BLCC-M114 TaxID=3022440 RepID=A0ABT7BEV6_9CYAN|nr:ribonuclease P protein component [Roseofilum capinflatum]MDJ1177109.1 ribonuclease P protein component [Roseofilum capinflatum BLCC-M114]